MKIYTKTGDNGTTGLFAGPRVSKDHPRIVAYGCVDELNALLGVLHCELPDEQDQWPISQFQTIRKLIQAIQADLFSIGAELATPDPIAQNMCLLSEERTGRLEEVIDEIDQQLPALSHFILPNGSTSSAYLHLARTVCRRAEREVVHLTHQPGVQDCERIIIYLNRLSDLLFVLARFVNHRLGIKEIIWEKQ